MYTHQKTTTLQLELDVIRLNKNKETLVKSVNRKEWKFVLDSKHIVK